MGPGHAGPGRFGPAGPRRAVGRPDSGARPRRPGRSRAGPRWSGRCAARRTCTGGPTCGRIAAALWPADAADAAARLSGDAGRLLGDGADPLEAFAVGRRRDAGGDHRADGEGRGQRRRDRGAPGASTPDSAQAAAPSTSANCSSGWPRCLPRSALVPDTKPVVLAPLVASVRRDRTSSRDWLSGRVAVLPAFGVGTPSDVGAHLGTSATGIRRRCRTTSSRSPWTARSSRVPASLLGSIADVD